MAIFSWFNSSDQVDTALVYVAVIGAVIELGVPVAAVINVHKEIEESRKKTLEKYIEIFACVAAFFFLAEAILGCRSSALLGIEVETMKKGNLVLQANVASLSGEMIQLAHQYDLTTNALAEAKSRLASVKPLKERLIAWLNGANPQILERLKSGQLEFHMTNVPDSKFAELQSLSDESGATSFISSIKHMGAINFLSDASGQMFSASDVQIVLKPELAQ